MDKCTSQDKPSMSYEILHSPWWHFRRGIWVMSIPSLDSKRSDDWQFLSVCHIVSFLINKKGFFNLCNALYPRKNDPSRTGSDPPAAQSGLPGEISQFLNGIGSVAATHWLINPVQRSRNNKLCGEPDQQVEGQSQVSAQIKDVICPTGFRDPINLA